MKKVFIIVIAVISLAACSKNAPMGVTSGEITYQTIVGKQGTRALVNGTAYPTDYTFGTAAFLQAGAELASTDVVYIPQSEVKYNDPLEGKWTTAVPYYWPAQGSRVTFISYSPFKTESTSTFPAVVSNEGISVADWNVDLDQTTDFMVADAATVNVSETVPGPVATVFRHKLAQIVAFKFYSRETIPGAVKKAGDIEFIVKKVVIKSVNTKGDYESGNVINQTNLGEWTAKTSAKDYIWYSDEAGQVLTAGQITDAAVLAPNQTPMSLNNYLLILPQEFAADGAASIEIVYDIKKYTGATSFTTETITADSKLYNIHDTHSWMMNKRITYTIGIGMDADRRIIWDPSVVAWEDQVINITY